jgi:hypothetical protein
LVKLQKLFRSNTSIISPDGRENPAVFFGRLKRTAGITIIRTYEQLASNKKTESSIVGFICYFCIQIFCYE